MSVTEPAVLLLDCVLLDIGGVLAPDPWQTMLLTPGFGLADRLGLDRNRVERIGEQTFAKHSRRVTSESEYWRELADALNVAIPFDLRRDIESLYRVTAPGAAELLRMLASSQFRVGIVSDNTAFWYPKQAGVLHLSRFVDPSLVFLSYQEGVSKQDDPGLLSIATEWVKPERTLVVDDRQPNLEQARTYGFLTHLREWGADLRDLVALIGSSSRGTSS